MNKGIDFAPELLKININEDPIAHLAQKITKRQISKQELAQWLLKAVTCTDLTTLSGDDTPGFVTQLCARAQKPLNQQLTNSFGVTKVAAVCVYPDMVATAVSALEDSDIPVAAVAAGFPSGLMPFASRVDEVERAVAAGAKEIDIVINRSLVLTGRWQELYYEITAFRQAAGRAHLKTILATGELGSLGNVAKASMVAMMAGSDFIKTSTGKETINATLSVGLVMLWMIRRYFALTGLAIGFKPAGGIRTSTQALEWLILIKEELGDEWLRPELFRLGASSLLNDIEQRLADLSK